MVLLVVDNSRHCLRWNTIQEESCRVGSCLLTLRPRMLSRTVDCIPPLQINPRSETHEPIRNLHRGHRKRQLTSGTLSLVADVADHRDDDKQNHSKCHTQTDDDHKHVIIGWPAIIQ